MPSKPLKPCNKHGCHTLTRDRYCEVHQQSKEEESKATNKHYNKYSRDPVITSFYKSKSWEKVRRYVLARDNGLCKHCLNNKHITAAEMVDHIVPIKVAWHLRLEPNNCQSLCNACHNKKTADDKIKYPHLQNSRKFS